jgi:uncharacterized protein GlcG (DUF336 family)
MANVVKKHSISFELAQKMVGAALAKAKELGVTENVAIVDDGGNLKAFGRMDGAPILSIQMAQNKAYTALFGVSTQEFFNFIQGVSTPEQKCIGLPEQKCIKDAGTRPPNWGLFHLASAWVGLFSGGSELAQRDRRLL